MMAAASALTEGPRVAGEPGVVQRGRAILPAAQRLQKGDDLEEDSCRVGEGEFVLAAILETIALVSNAVEAPGAKPITFGVTAGGGPRPALRNGVGD